MAKNIKDENYSMFVWNKDIYLIRRILKYSIILFLF